MKSKDAIQKALAVAFLLAAFPLSSAGEVLQGKVFSGSGISGKTGNTAMGAWRGPESEGTGQDRKLRMGTGRDLPQFIQRIIHRHLQYRRQADYLDFVTEGIRRSGHGGASLALQLDTEGSAVREAYFNFAGTNPRDRLNFLQQQKGFVMAMIRYMQAAEHESPGMHRQNLEFFSELLTRMKSIASVTIAESGLLNDYQNHVHPEAFVVPQQLLDSGNAGALGAVLDTLKNSDYDVRPNVMQRFLRQVNVLFSTSV